jgi:hypothetical protein
MAKIHKGGRMSQGEDPALATGPLQKGQAPTRDDPRHRDYDFTYTPTSSVAGPMGPMNVGYVHNVVSTNAQWTRGDLPDMSYGYAFALARPRFMREPRTNVGTYNLAKG